MKSCLNCYTTSILVLLFYEVICIHLIILNESSYEMDSKLSCHNGVKTSFSTDVAGVEDKSILPKSNEKGPNLKSVMKKPKESKKLKNSTYQRKYFNPHVPPQKSAPVHVHISNPSAEVVLRERKIEIKDLESQVVYLRNKIKEFQIENKTLSDLQTRQEKELRKFKAGVADLPSMLRSHKDEIKAVESNAFSLRRELKDCQKDLKAKNDLILKKDQQLDKFNLVLKRSDKHIQEVTIENKELKLHNKKCEEESKRLSGGNEELKSKNDRLQKKIQHMTGTILDLEEKLGSTDHFKNQLKENLCKVQKKCDELLLSEAALKKSLQISKNTSSTQTDSAKTISVSCMTINPLFDERISNEKDGNAEYEELKKSGDADMGNKVECLHWGIANQKKVNNDFPLFFFSTDMNNTQLDSRVQQKHQLKPPKDISSISMKLFENRQDFIYSKVESEHAKHLSSKSFKFQANNFANKDLFTKHPVSMENRSNHNCDNEDRNLMLALLDCGSSRNSAMNIGNQKLKHFSNLTLK